eukprot:TRINITY_DN3259_c0_g2_i1.p1 TRINITY_DN3259_c0_g2~~TRINITY_DN3259_c0_g2_i1.p1  ORF type:complete len:199 (+),score=-21.01 TRINITY_DN3259_c0_g2_i1:332-928(+)
MIVALILKMMWLQYISSWILFAMVCWFTCGILFITLWIPTLSVHVISSSSILYLSCYVIFPIMCNLYGGSHNLNWSYFGVLVSCTFLGLSFVFVPLMIASCSDCLTLLYLKENLRSFHCASFYAMVLCVFVIGYNYTVLRIHDYSNQQAIHQMVRVLTTSVVVSLLLTSMLFIIMSNCLFTLGKLMEYEPPKRWKTTK